MLRAFLGFLIGAVLGGGLALGLGILWMSTGRVDMREGAAAMGLVFFVIPAAAVVGGIVGLVVALVSRKRPGRGG